MADPRPLLESKANISVKVVPQSTSKSSASKPVSTPKISSSDSAPPPSSQPAASFDRQFESWLIFSQISIFLQDRKNFLYSLVILALLYLCYGISSAVTHIPNSTLLDQVRQNCKQVQYPSASCASNVLNVYDEEGNYIQYACGSSVSVPSPSLFRSINQYFVTALKFGLPIAFPYLARLVGKYALWYRYAELSIVPERLTSRKFQIDLFFISFTGVAFVFLAYFSDGLTTAQSLDCYQLQESSSKMWTGIVSVIAGTLTVVRYGWAAIYVWKSIRDFEQKYDSEFVETIVQSPFFRDNYLKEYHHPSLSV
eukprot:TRINITY_DN6680_c0_g1_i2.p1 TRINITY_DN6680_c0_g1~~TRINITY_DN6680_c0_g1_i2.p1  ORF type:complete len:336 (-),score=81.67 TRINITY_DN6680_c0_g1_i2:231-1163(-)